jgi:mannose-6-phosphate isomerase-like protein (cupin superfamily)
MNRRKFIGNGSGAALTAILVRPPGTAAKSDFDPNPQKSGRSAVLVRAGMTRKPDGTDVPTPDQQTVVRSFDSEGRLAAFVVPISDHAPYRGAPLHVHHEQDEWIYILAGVFVAEVGGKRIRLKSGDSLLMPMRVPHRWSFAEQAHGGAIHLYTPAGSMDVSWDPKPDDDAPKTEAQRKAEFESYGMTLLGAPLTKEEIDSTK